MKRSPDGALKVEPRHVRFVDFPKPFAAYHEGELSLKQNGNIVSLPDGSLLTTLYGNLEGDDKDGCFAAVSTDGGCVWRYRGTVASCEDLPDATEGANESSMQLLQDGDLFCIFRTGGELGEYHKSYSGDGGGTWSHPARMSGMFSVQPRLVLLDNGALVLIGGRPGLFLWVCTDGRCNSWDTANLGVHHNEHVDGGGPRYSAAFCRAERGETPAMSTAYTGLMPWGEDGVVVAYDRLANGWDGAPGSNGDVDAVFSIRVRVIVR